MILTSANEPASEEKNFTTEPMSNFPDKNNKIEKNRGSEENFIVEIFTLSLPVIHLVFQGVYFFDELIKIESWA